MFCRNYVPRISLILCIYQFVGMQNCESFAQKAIEGKVIANQSSVISSEITGERSIRVVNLIVGVGDRVKKGDVIAKLSTEQLEALRNVSLSMLEEAKALVGVSEADVAQAQLTYNRQVGLRNSPSFRRAAFEDSEVELKRAQSNLKNAQANVSRQQAEVERLNLEIKLATILAPYDGIVIKVLTNVGATVTQTNPFIAELLDTSRTEIELEVGSDGLSKFKIGNELSYTLDGNERFPARIRAIFPKMGDGASSIMVRLELDDNKVPQYYFHQQPVRVFVNN